MTKVIIRKRYQEHQSEAQNTIGESLTHQQFKEECDVNHILAKYRKTNMSTHLS